MNIPITNLGKQKKKIIVKTYIPPGYTSKKARKAILALARLGSKNALANMREAKIKDQLRKVGYITDDK